MAALADPDRGWDAIVIWEYERAFFTYVREDQILPHLAAISVLLAGGVGKPDRRSSVAAQVNGPADAAGLIDQLRADRVVLAYNPDDRTLRVDSQDAPSVTISKNH